MAIAKAKNNNHCNNNTYNESIIDNQKITIYHNNDIDIKYKPIDLLATRILVLSLVKDPAHSFTYISTFIKDLTNTIPNTQFSFFTNNSHTNSTLFFNLLLSEYKNVQILKYIDEIIDKNNRIHKLAYYRNMNFEYAIKTLGTSFDYVIFFDSDIASDIPVDLLVQSMGIDCSWSCISANCTYSDSTFYYDELALRLPNSSKNICDIHPKFNQYYGDNQKWIDCFRIFNGWTIVDNAFGCLAIYKMKELLDVYNQYNKLYDLTNYPEFTAEHITLQDKLPNAKIICPFIKYTNKSKIEDLNMSNAFVPRDAGFFSVFNFYIGCLTQGFRSYPLWNKDELLKLHSSNHHFAYWTDNYNCWFDYFEPVQFFDNDTNHTTETYLKLPRYSGENGPEEFRIPSATKNLLKGDKDKFKQWRLRTHQFYQQFIKFKPEIIESVNNIWTHNSLDNQNVIGVHYRHPSHFIESGKVYLEDYFEQIDKILSVYPTSKIFLASDSQFGIYAFVERYGEKIVYIKDIDRLSMAEFLHWAFGLADGKADHVGFINGKGYELHHKRVNQKNNKKMTTDLLKEVLCLAKCNQIINNISNIPLAISYINPETEIITL